jgi:hypothetical protein
MTTAAIITTVAAVGGTVGGAAIAAHGQTKAAETQAKAQEGATTAQEKAAADALAFQKQQYNNTQKAINPYQNMGLGALSALGSGLGVTPGNLPVNQIAPDRQVGTTTSGFMSPGDFTQFKGAVDANAQAQAQNSGGFGQQARLNQANAQANAQALSASSVAAQPGETRTVNGQQARWDGKGWEAV